MKNYFFLKNKIIFEILNFRKLKFQNQVINLNKNFVVELKKYCCWVIFLKNSYKFFLVQKYKKKFNDVLILNDFKFNTFFLKNKNKNFVLGYFIFLLKKIIKSYSLLNVKKKLHTLNSLSKHKTYRKYLYQEIKKNN